jgi:hypothetical protein
MTDELEDDRYAKVFVSMLDSSIWGEDERTRLVWVTVLLMKDHRGYVGASVDGIARRARVPVEDVERALTRFQEPDPRSRSQEHEGRRIERHGRGWLVLNHQTFRDMGSSEARREKNRQAQQRFRQKGKAK